MRQNWQEQHEARIQRFLLEYSQSSSNANRSRTTGDGTLSPACVKAFRALISHHSRSHRRQFPWRSNRTPYRVLVSEIMLQQTQANRVVDKYRQFLKAFPSLRRLAQTTPAEVLRNWQGLGYNRRGLALHRAAVSILEEHAGRVPRTREALEALPGIGPYTASAIRTFAFGYQEVVLETNIRTVFIHFFFPNHTKVRDESLLPLIEQVSVHQGAAEWYDALMDYGAMLKAEGKCQNQRNPQYRKQSKFKGSRRELRGKLVRELSREVSLTKKRLKERCEDDERYDEVLATLVEEGLVEMKKGRVMLCGAK